MKIAVRLALAFTLAAAVIATTTTVPPATSEPAPQTGPGSTFPCPPCSPSTSIKPN